MGKKWVKDRKREQYYKLAKREHYRSRAAFKLKQMNKKFKLLKRGNIAVDLGAAPGGWMQVVRKVVGERGFVLGVDLEKIAPFEGENVATLQGDITDGETIEKINDVLPRKADVVISDASPDISGVWDIDHFRSIDLARNALEIAKNILSPGGNFLVKVFQGSEVEKFKEELKREFEFVKVLKPRASRDKSSEIYLLGKGFLKTPVRVGDELEVTIESIGKDGDGVCILKGFPLFVKDAKMGESLKVKVKKVTNRFAKGVPID
ncbi:MAG: SAM-dependent methyltransferase [Candidatus Hydrothermarchaeales archaeon]